MEVIYLVIETCLIYLGELVSFLGCIDIAEGISLLEFIYALIILTVVISALISVVKFGSIGIGNRYRSAFKAAAREHAVERRSNNKSKSR